MQKINYQKILDELIGKLQKENKIPKLLLHSCCDPCSSYVLEYLSKYFRITVLYYNPNISIEEEYLHRIEEQISMISEMKTINKVDFVQGEYNPNDFFAIAKGLEDAKEGGERCFKCYELRLKETVKIALDNGYDYFTTTLSISPHKNAQKINEIGEKLSEEYGVKYLYSDFKKREGYKRSIELSKEYNLYRQNYCGCIYSKLESESYNNSK